MRTFSCDEARAHFSDALAGEIARPDAGVLESHLLDCGDCRSLAELFVWQDRVISELAAQARMEKLLGRVRQGLERLDQVVVAEDRPRYSIVVPWKPIALAAAAILAIVFVWSARKPAVEPTITKALDPVVLPQPAPQQEPVVAETEPVKEAPAPVLERPPKPVPVEAAPVAPPPKPAPLIAKPVPPPAPPPPPPPPPVPATGGPGKEVVALAPKPKSLDDAVRGGMAYLKAKAALLAKETRNDELVLWTYLHGGVADNDPEFQALLKIALEKKLEKTYNVALTAMVLEELDRVKHQKRIAQCAQFLLDNQCTNGQWGYGDPSIFAEDLSVPPLPPKFKGVRKVVVTRKRDGAAAGDNSNTMYALLGLRACHDAAVTLPVATLELATKWWRDSQTRTARTNAVAAEGWCYGKHEHKPYGSMTAGGVGSLVICDYILGRDWKKDREVANGMEWLSKNFSVSYNPGPYEHANFEENSQHQFYYYMYALERAAVLYGTEQIGPHAWFAKGLQAMIDQQRPDGSWKCGAGGSELMDTCFAVLFLRKATRALVDVPTVGAGSKK